MTTAFETITSIRGDVQHSLKMGASKLTHHAPSVPLELLYQGRVFPLPGKVTPRTDGKRWNDDLKKNPYKEKGDRNRVTCEALFCFDDNESNGFSRTTAVRYLTRKLVYGTRSNAKGKASEPSTVKARKTSSSRHRPAFYAASDIEDIVQDAFIIFLNLNAGEHERGVKLSPEGDKKRLYDTCNCTREAMKRLTRARWKEAKRVKVLDARMKARGDAERSYANRFYDEELEQLLSACREHGVHKQADIALTLGISQGEVSKRFARLRERAERMERN